MPILTASLHVHCTCRLVFYLSLFALNIGKILQLYGLSIIPMIGIVICKTFILHKRQLVTEEQCNMQTLPLVLQCTCNKCYKLKQIIRELLNLFTYYLFM